MRRGDPGKSGPDSSHDMCKGPGAGAQCVQRMARGLEVRGSVRSSEEEIREVKGQRMDLALTLSEMGPGGF